MPILVQKFGGTSIGTKENRKYVINHIKNALDKHDKIIVVVSALGRQPDPYATDTLLSLVSYPSHYVTNQELDLLMACGENISAVVLSNELRKENISARALTGAQAGIITDRQFTGAKINYIESENILRILQDYEVVVVAGFQGQTETGEVATIGRGGSDTTAAALGAALKAERIDIYTDVHGIMTADPQIVKTAKLLPVVSYIETCHLAYQGTKIIHPRAVEIAMKAKVPIRIRPTHTKEEGTLVTTQENNLEKNMLIKERPVTGIAYVKNIVQIQIPLNIGLKQMQSNIFKTLAQAGISVDFIHISPAGLSFTVYEDVAEKAKDLLLTLGYHPHVTYHCAKVSIIGVGMSGVPGIISTIVETLTNLDIQILQSADSHTTIWVLIDRADLSQAVVALHDVFELNHYTF